MGFPNRAYYRLHQPKGGDLGSTGVMKRTLRVGGPVPLRNPGQEIVLADEQFALAA